MANLGYEMDFLTLRNIELAILVLPPRLLILVAT